MDFGPTFERCMPSAPLHALEASRIDALEGLHVLDSGPNPLLDGLVHCAALLTGCPASVLSLVHKDRQWFKARLGTDDQETPRSKAFCAHTILQEGLFEVRDARLDPRFSDYPQVLEQEGLRFYAGVPLTVAGLPVGTLCVFDNTPRQLDEPQRRGLIDLARAAEHWLTTAGLQRELHESAKKWSGLFMQIADGVLLLDERYRILDANTSAESLLASTKGQLMNRKLGALLPRCEHRRLRTVVKSLIAGHASLELWQVKRSGNSTFTAEVHVRKLEGAGYVAVIRDVTSRREQEAKLHLLSMAVEQSSASIVISDTKATIQYANEAATTASGYLKTDLIGENSRILQSGKTPKETYAQMWRNLSAGIAWRGTLFNKRKDGTEYVVNSVITPIKDSTGKTVQYLSVMEDITEKRAMLIELDKHRLHLEEIVEQRTNALTAARRAAEAASEAKSAFLATMSHEIRTPMNGIIGTLDVLQASELSQDQQELASTIQESATALLSIIDDILDFSKIEAGQMSLNLESVDLHELLKRTVTSQKAAAAERNVQLSLELGADTIRTVVTDKVRLRQVILNLVNNAIKFSGKEAVQGEVVVKASTPNPRQLTLSVSDNGIGMTPEVMARIFKPFVQGESSTTRQFGGTGLGLSICKRLVSLFGGKIDVQSIPGRGTKFTATIPLPEASDTPNKQPAYDAHTEFVDDTALGRFSFTALVAEDNEINQRVIARQLQMLGVSVEIASDGIQAYEMWRAARDSKKYGLILTDIHMPEVDGYELTKRIRDEETPDERIPIVAITANALKGEAERCLEAGMNGYLPKPIKLIKLSELLRNTQKKAATQKIHEGAPIFLSLLPNFDPTVLPNLIDHDPSLIAEFRGHFIAQATREGASLYKAVERGDWEAVTDIAHRLKSSAQTIGALALGEYCERLEKAPPSPEGQMIELVRQVQASIRNAVMRIQNSGTHYHPEDVQGAQLNEHH